MIYTIGHRKSYDRGLREMGDALMKVGQRAEIKGKPYLGGSVWQTREEVDRYLEVNGDRLAEYAVYGVLADWDESTVQHQGEPFRRLLVDSRIVALP